MISPDLNGNRQVFQRLPQSFSLAARIMIENSNRFIGCSSILIGRFHCDMPFFHPVVISVSLLAPRGLKLDFPPVLRAANEVRGYGINNRLVHLSIHQLITDPSLINDYNGLMLLGISVFKLPQLFATKKSEDWVR